MKLWWRCVNMRIIRETKRTSCKQCYLSLADVIWACRLEWGLQPTNSLYVPLALTLVVFGYPFRPINPTTDDAVAGELA